MKKDTYLKKEILLLRISRRLQDSKKSQNSIERKTLYSNNNQRKNIRVSKDLSIKELEEKCTKLTADINISPGLTIQKKEPKRNKERKVMVSEVLDTYYNSDEPVKKPLNKNEETEIKKDTGQKAMNNPPFKLERFEAANDQPLYRLEPPDL
ncbi:7842_t:CDS:2 [Cetraspora pellucida]|uniref:7842_t:CDS:1 n=1 Tax=Cetraspora pellucida TaxID=1433469 RepID=A0ACA9NUM1_9GLOM|nr:7842_t:CDS:2 [Cetraspora pellucida]